MGEKSTKKPIPKKATALPTVSQCKRVKLSKGAAKLIKGSELNKTYAMERTKEAAAFKGKAKASSSDARLVLAIATKYGAMQQQASYLWDADVGTSKKKARKGGSRK